MQNHYMYVWLRFRKAKTDSKGVELILTCLVAHE